MKLMTTVFLFAATLLSACAGSSSGSADVSFNPRDTVNVPEGVTGQDSIAYIENAVTRSPISAADLLGLAEVHAVEDYLAYYNDLESTQEHLEVTHRDSAAMRLANRFMRMGNLVKMNGNANDKLQWAVAVKAAMDIYHKAVPSVPADSIIGEIGKVVYKFSSQTQYELNFMCYVDAMVDYYRTIECYRQWLSVVPAKLKPLLQEEYEAWHDLNDARFAFWNDVSYKREWYSMKPMEIEGYYEKLSCNRRAEMEIERAIILDNRPYRQLGQTVTTAQWQKWIADHSVPEDVDFMREMGQEDDLPSDSLVNQRVTALKSAFSRWTAARHAISAALPKDQGQSYDNLTADIHSRLIGKLADIVPFDEW